MNWAPEWRTIQLANKSSLSEFRTSLLFRSPTVFKTPCHTAIPKWMPDLSPPLQSSHLWRVNNLILFEVHVSGSLGLKKQDWFKNIFKDCGGLFKILFCIYAVQCTRCIQLKKYILKVILQWFPKGIIYFKYKLNLNLCQCLISCVVCCRKLNILSC